MDNNFTNDLNSPNFSPDSREIELSHSDKIAGVFSEPAKTFEITSKFPLRTIDWILPIILLLILSIISQFILFNNPEISYQMQQKQREAVQKMVDEGKITQEQADKQSQFMTGSVMVIIRSVSTLIFGFIFFLIITGSIFSFLQICVKRRWELCICFGCKRTDCIYCHDSNYSGNSCKYNLRKNGSGC